MESAFQLNLPEPTTPTIKIETNGDNHILSSPQSLQLAGDMASMINTGGTPIASLKTPTKVLTSQNSTSKHTLALSPTRLYIKVC